MNEFEFSQACKKQLTTYTESNDQSLMLTTS